MIRQLNHQVIEKLREKLNGNPLLRELREKPFLCSDSISAKLAVANLNPFLIIAHGKAVIALRADRDIPANVQLGFSYGLGYWDLKKLVPRYFNRASGLMIPKSEYLPELSEVCKRYRKPSETDLPGLNSTFRRAAFRGNVEDLEILLEHGADIDSKSALSGKTAF